MVQSKSELYVKLDYKENNLFSRLRPSEEITSVWKASKRIPENDVIRKILLWVKLGGRYKHQMRS